MKFSERIEMDPIIITVASTGGKWTRHDSVYVPLTPDEIVADTEECFKMGASMAHVHARDGEGNPSQDPVVFGDIIDKIRSHCPGMIIQISTGMPENQFEQKLLPLMKLRPEMASLGLKLTKEEIKRAVSLMNDHKVMPVVECYTIEMLKRALLLLKNGILRPPLIFELVSDSDARGRNFEELADDLLARVRILPRGSVWSQTRGMEHQYRLQCLSILFGGHIRTGLEDNLFIEPEIKAKRSAELIKKVLYISKAIGRSTADPSQSRKILHLKD